MFGSLWEMLIIASLEIRNIEEMASSQAQGRIASVSRMKQLIRNEGAWVYIDYSTLVTLCEVGSNLFRLLLPARK